MSFHERPNLKTKMVEAERREKAIHDARQKNPNISEYEKNIMKQAIWDRRAAQTNYYSQSGQGSAPWQKKLEIWAIIAGIGSILLVGLFRLS